jgi:hypothetical protein
MSSELHDHHHKKTAVLLIAPETGRLPNGMGPLARFISGKSGGMGDVISTLCEGLTRRGKEEVTFDEKFAPSRVDVQDRDNKIKQFLSNSV